MQIFGGLDFGVHYIIYFLHISLILLET